MAVETIEIITQLEKAMVQFKQRRTISNLRRYSTGNNAEFAYLYPVLNTHTISHRLTLLTILNHLF